MKYNRFIKAINRPYFTRSDIRLNKLSVYDSQISLWKSKGELQQIKRGVYVFTDRVDEISAEEISFIIYNPSYISLETALSEYGLIPDMVPSITSVTTKATRNFSNIFGKFIYRTIQPKLFFGYRAVNTKYGKYLYAYPEKAILDFFYLNSRSIKTKDDLEEMRFNREALKEIINIKRMNRYLECYKSKQIAELVKMLLS